MYVFLSCVKTKLDKKAYVKDMYISPLFKFSLAYARTLTVDDKIFVLSAKYGLLKLDDIISPYEKSLNEFKEKERKIWAYNTFRQIEKIVDLNEEAIFLCGMNYRKYIITKFKNASVPLKGLMLGEQLQFYKKALNENKNNC